MRGGTAMCQGCEVYLKKIDELNEEMRTLKRSNIRLRKKTRYTSRKLSKILKETNENTRHYRNNRKKDAKQHKRI